MKTKYKGGFTLVAKYVKTVFPEVDKELARWAGISKDAEDHVLSKEAFSSIRHKRFHAQGGCVYSLYPGVAMDNAIKLITAFQTISDYLDNLCDRTGVKDEQAFRQLHLSMLDAVDMEHGIHDYYKYYPYKKDNNYLYLLVNECRQQILKLPSYSRISDTVIKYVSLYSDLQVYKHLPGNIREARLIEWANKYLPHYPGISCWEFSAAAGSTLGMFVLFSAASDKALTPEDVKTMDNTYFPWVCGLHILLDYYIDAEEDLQTDDLNFTTYYKNIKQCEERISVFIENALKSCTSLRYPKFHLTVIKGLLAMYISDPKARLAMHRTMSRSLIKKAGIETNIYYKICRMLRALKIL